MIGWLFHAYFNIFERVVKRSKQYACKLLFCEIVHITIFDVANSSRGESTSILLFLLFHKISSSLLKSSATRTEVEILPISFEQRSLLILSSFPLIAIRDKNLTQHAQDTEKLRRESSNTRYSRS